MAIYRKCSAACDSCNGPYTPDSGCLTCRSGYFLWDNTYINWNGRCYSFCPSFSIGVAQSYVAVTDVGQYRSSSPNDCASCDVRCNFCDGPLNTDCYSCRGGYYLIDDTSSQCVTRFSCGAIPPESTCYYDQCWTTQNACPTFYFYVPQSTVNSTDPYYTWTTQRDVWNGQNANVKNRQLNANGICYFCNSHCLVCNGPNQDNCVSCKRFNYRWNQRSNYCQETCPRGDYEYSTTTWRGEWIN